MGNENYARGHEIRDGDKCLGCVTQPNLNKEDCRQMSQLMSQLLTVKEAAVLFSCSPAAIRKWIYQRRLRAVKIGRLTRLRQEDIERVASTGMPARSQTKQAA